MYGDSYLHAWNCKSLTAYNFGYDCARDLISFLVDQKYEVITENENQSIIMAVVP